MVGILNSFNFAIEHGVFHRDQKTSLISLLLKKGKDPLDCSSYRPISLIPCDLKIYAKVFASRMEKVIHSLIKEDQTGFIKGRNASDNMRRLGQDIGELTEQHWAGIGKELAPRDRNLTEIATSVVVL